jgi:hypothetical protein
LTISNGRAEARYGRLSLAAAVLGPIKARTAPAAKIIGQKQLVPQRKTTKVPNERLTAARAAPDASHVRRGNGQLSFAGRREENQVS